LTKTYRRPRLRVGEREYLTAALIKYLIRPGLMRAAELMLNQMEVQKDADIAKAIILLSKDLAIRGFPTKDERDAANELTDALMGARVETALPELVEDDDYDDDADEDINRAPAGSEQAEPIAPAEARDLEPGSSIDIPRP
jgi:hypothetical protein